MNPLLLSMLMCGGSTDPPPPPPPIDLSSLAPPTVKDIKPAKKRPVRGRQRGGLSAFSLRRFNPTATTGRGVSRGGGGGASPLSLRN